MFYFVIIAEAGGSVQGMDSGQNADYYVYVRYDAMNSMQFPNIPNPNSTLSFAQMEEILETRLKEKDVLGKINDSIAVKFGLSAVRDRFANRMGNYNRGEEDTTTYKAIRISSKFFNDHVLIDAGDKFTLKDGSVVVMSADDIIRFEMAAIHMFEFGKFIVFKNNLLNIRGGGGFPVSSSHPLLYFRLFNKVKSQPKEIVEIQKDNSRMKIDIPYVDGKIQWSEMLALWKVAVYNGVLLKRPKEKGKIILLFFLSCFNFNYF